MQIAWPYEIFADSVVCRRITSTGALKIYVRVVNPSALQEGIWVSSSKELTSQTPWSLLQTRMHENSNLLSTLRMCPTVILKVVSL